MNDILFLIEREPTAPQPLDIKDETYTKKYMSQKNIWLKISVHQTRVSVFTKEGEPGYNLNILKLVEDKKK